MSKPTFTFKKMIHTGRYKGFEKDFTDIKLKRKIVGYIREVEFRKYKISFAVKKEPTKEDPAPFRWVRLVIQFKTEKEAREFLKERAEDIINKYDLYSFDD